MANKKYIQIEIDGLTADLPAEDPNIQITYVNPCAGGFGTISGNKSERSLSLPATKQNDEIFSSWWKVNQANTPSAAEEKNASIKVNGLSVIDGKAQLKNVSTVGRFYERGGKDYSVSFFGANADWFEQLNDLELGRDLDWSAENHNYDNANITAGFNASPSNVYAYGVVKLEDWANYDDTVTPRITYVDLYQCTPLLFIGEIVKKAFNSIGYTLSAGFFSNPVNERYVLPVPLPSKYPQDYSDDYLNVRAIKTITQNITSANPFGVNGVHFDAQTQTPPLAAPNPLVLNTPGTQIIGVGNVAQYTAPDAGFYQVRLTATVGNIGGALNFNFALYGAGIPVIFANYAVALTALDNGNTYSFEYIVELEQGGVIESFGYVSAFSLDITAASLEIIGEASIGPGTLIDFKYLLRDWKVTDFIKGLTAAFNLCWETNVNLKTVLVEPKDDYLVTNRSTATPSIVPGFHTSTTTDSTPKLDFNKNGRVTAVNNIAETQQYQWKKDSSDKTAEATNELEDIPFDAAKYVMPLNRFKPDTEENENPFFAPTVMIFDEEIREETSLFTPCIPLMWPDNYRDNTTAPENTTEFAPRILWFGGQRSGDDGIIETIDGLTGLNTKRFLPALFFVNYNDTSGLDVSLNWSTLTINGNTVQGHLQKFYLRESRRMREGKELEEHIYWDELDILNLSFRPKILLNNGLYIMKEINSYSPIIDRSTKTILVYDLPASQEDVNRIDNTLAVGFIGQYSDSDG